VTQSNSRFNALDKLVLNIHAVKMPVGFGKGDAIKSMGRPLEIMAHLKRSIVQVTVEKNCLAHALLISKAKVDNVQIIIRTLKVENSVSSFNTCSRRRG
jgi:hypothetical protein